MSIAKKYLIAFALCCSILVILLANQTHAVNTLEGVVLSNTLTQSLDGERRFVTVEDTEGNTFVISTDVHIQCEIGDRAHLSQKKGLFTQSAAWQLIQCQ